MKKLFVIVLALLGVTGLSGCKKDEKYLVGATAIPHAEILEYVKPLLKEKGYEFEIKVFNDYVLPNKALDQGELIANFFQHIPYLESQIGENGYDFTNVGGVHIEPIGLYSKEYTELENLPKDLEIIISNSPSDRPRLFAVLEEAGLISSKSSVTSEDYINSTVNNLPTLFTASNSRNVTFTEVAPELLYTNYQNESGEAVLINGNYALDNGLNPLIDALVLEGSASDYVNIVVAKNINLDNEFVVALVETLQSDEVQNWIKDNYGGAVVPAASQK